MAPPVKKKAAELTGIYADIVAVLSKPRQAGETYPKYIERVGKIISEMDDDAFGKFSKETQEWFDAAVEVSQIVPKVSEDKLPVMSGWPADVPVPEQAAPPAVNKPAPAAAPAAAPPAASTKQETAPVATKKKAAAKPAAKKAAPAAKKKLPTKKGAKPAQARLPGTGKGEAKARTDGVSYQIRLAVIKKHDITFEAAAEKAGVKKPEVGSHAHNMWNHARIICAMQDALLK